ncbi:Carboxypeptidase Y A [Erysiphe necator]|nr:Carboxypeptidase Y A [Erysiphe necator]
MKLILSTLIFGATATIIDSQQPLYQKPLKEYETIPTPVKNEIADLILNSESIWDEIPDFLDSMSRLSTPKPSSRNPDSTWDFITKGSDIHNLWIENSNGEREREVDGSFETYDLRTKKVDPSRLGVDTVKQYSGYLDDNENDKHLFYWFFESRNDPKNDPVLLWLNGGPGCSSLTGLFAELGPASVNKNLTLAYNPFSWNANASVIFLDQPVNVGYSYSSRSVSDTVAAGKDIYALLTLFFKQFPEYATQDFHIAGESYGGHYVPVFVSEILSYKNRNINLKSALIGNGITDPLTQYDYLRPMACGEGGYPAVLEESQCQRMDNALPRCQSLIKNCYESESIWACVPAGIYCNNALIGPYQNSGQNVYDVRTQCEDPENLCYSITGWIRDYLNQKHVMNELGAEVSSYEGCSDTINRNFLFHGDWMKPYHKLVPGILDQIPLLIYAGDADFICNWLGNKAWTEALEWKGKSLFNKAESKNIELGNGNKYGKIKSSGNFTFLQIFEAGHMVPMNQPEVSLDFLNRWLHGEWSN